jgi:hypothetical protein
MKTGTMASDPIRAALALCIISCAVILPMVWADGSSRRPTQGEKDFEKTLLHAVAKAVPRAPAGWEESGGRADIRELNAIYSDPNQPFSSYYSVSWQDTKRIMEAEQRYAEQLMKLAQTPGFKGEGAETLRKRLEPKDVKATIKISTNVGNQGIEGKALPAPKVAGEVAYTSQRDGSLYVLLGGSWKMDPQSDEWIKFSPPRKVASSTVVQNIVVRIQADPSRMASIVQGIDWESLKSLIAK